MSRWWLVLLSSVLVTGCAFVFPEEKELPPVPAASAQTQQEQQEQQEEFESYLDDFLAGGDLDDLELYLAGTSGNKQHAAMRHLLQQLIQCRTEHREMTAKLASSSEQIVDLENQNLQLLETIEQLKSLLIQLEQRVH